MEWGAMILARSGALFLGMALPPRPRERTFGDSGVACPAPPSRWGLVFALALSFVFAAPVAGALAFGSSVIVSAAATLGWTKLCRDKLGGQTGDVIGALQGMIELGALLVLLIFS